MHLSRAAWPAIGVVVHPRRTNCPASLRGLFQLSATGFRLAVETPGVRQASMFDPAEASRLPSGGPSPDNLLPVDWPPDTVGTPFKSALKR
jgi:hypothetical protein